MNGGRHKQVCGFVRVVKVHRPIVRVVRVA